MTPGTRRAATALLAAGCSAALAACSGSGSGSAATTAPSSSGASAATSTAPRSPEVTLPPSVASALPSLPSGLGGADPCAHATTAFTAASAYLALAQLGQAALAQTCVQGGGVSAQVTAALRATSVVKYFVPAGSTTGSTIDFRRVDGTTTAAVTLTRSGDHFVVTGVRIG